MQTLIEIQHLNAGYDGRTVLRDVDLTVYDRDFLGIIGPNGGGKTTLIRCILGLLKPRAALLPSILKRTNRLPLPSVTCPSMPASTASSPSPSRRSSSPA